MKKSFFKNNKNLHVKIDMLIDILLKTHETLDYYYELTQGKGKIALDLLEKDELDTVECEDDYIIALKQVVNEYLHNGAKITLYSLKKDELDTVECEDDYIIALRQVVNEYLHNGGKITIKCPKCNSAIKSEEISNNAFLLVCKCGYMCDIISCFTETRKE